MTQPTNEYDSYDITGIREQLFDWISNIAPWETPFMSNIGTAKAENTLFEWQKDTLGSASENAAVEGDQPTNLSITATTRLNNRTQISQKTIEISDTTAALNIAGRPSEMDYQISLQARVLKTDQETVLMANTAKAAGSSSTARHTAGVPTWIATNVNKASDGTNPAGTGAGTRGAGTARAFAESQVRDVQQQCYNAGAKPNALMLSPFNKSSLGSGFTGGATRYVESVKRKLVNAVDVYEGEFGSLDIMPNRLQPTGMAFLLDTDLWKVSYLRSYKISDLAKVGDSTRKQLVVEYGLVAMNETGNGIVADLTAS